MTAGSALAEGVYLQWGIIQISVANLVVIALMVLLFVLAITVPFGRRKSAGKP